LIFQAIEPRVTNKPVDQKRLAKFQEGLETSLDYMENVFLKESLYLAGEDISIADLLGICELMQPYSTGHDIKKGRPRLAAYVERMQQQLQPHFDPAHVMVYKIRDLFKAKM
jgi:glutathione S-transferase